MTVRLLSEFECIQLAQRIPAGVYIIDGFVYRISMIKSSTKARYLKTIPHCVIERVDCLICIGKIHDEYRHLLPSNAEFL